MCPMVKMPHHYHLALMSYLGCDERNNGKLILVGKEGA